MATWDLAYEAIPAGTDSPTAGDDNMRDMKLEERQRLDQEHVWLNTASTGETVHREGSARVYFDNTEPTLRPDGVTSLDVNDDGRIWIDSNNSNLLTVYDGTAGAFENINVATATLATTATTATHVADQGGGNALLTKVVTIGDWNMSNATGTDFKNVAHGLGGSWKNVRAVDVIIRNDMDTIYYNLYRHIDNPDPLTLGGGITSFDSTNVELYRRTGGIFDGASFNATSYNRGWITIWYTA